MSLPRLFSLPKNTLVGAHTHFTKAGSILNRLLITLFLSLVYHRYSCYVIEGKNKLLRAQTTQRHRLQERPWERTEGLKGSEESPHGSR